MALAQTFNSATHDPESLFVIFGEQRITGWAPGDFLTIEAVGEDFTLESGPDGLDVWNRIHVSAVNISLVLMAASAANQYLWAKHMLDRMTPGGVLLPFTFWEKNGLTKLVSPRARIMKRPPIVRGATAGNITWNLTASQLEGIVGGLLGPSY